MVQKQHFLFIHFRECGIVTQKRLVYLQRMWKCTVLCIDVAFVLHWKGRSGIWPSSTNRIDKGVCRGQCLPQTTVYSILAPLYCLRTTRGGGGGRRNRGEEKGPTGNYWPSTFVLLLLLRLSAALVLQWPTNDRNASFTTVT